MIGAVILGLCLLPGAGQTPDDGEIFQALLVAYNASIAVDAGLTVSRINGHREGNPLLPDSKAGIIGVKTGLAAGSSWALWELHKRHPRAARWILVAGIAAHVAGAVHNARRK